MLKVLDCKIVYEKVPEDSSFKFDVENMESSFPKDKNVWKC